MLLLHDLQYNKRRYIVNSNVRKTSKQQWIKTLAHVISIWNRGIPKLSKVQSYTCVLVTITTVQSSTTQPMFKKKNITSKWSQRGFNTSVVGIQCDTVYTCSERRTIVGCLHGWNILSYKEWVVSSGERTRTIKDQRKVWLSDMFWVIMKRLEMKRTIERSVWHVAVCCHMTVMWWVWSYSNRRVHARSYLKHTQVYFSILLYY